MSGVFDAAIEKMNQGIGFDEDVEQEHFIGEEVAEEDETVVDNSSENVIQIEDDSEPTSGRRRKRKSDMKGRKRLLTLNFKELQVVDATDVKALQNWKAEMAQHGHEVITYDRRNFIYCASPTGDFRMLQNYYELLNSLSSQWVNYDLFDQGYLPYVYWPSFRTDREGIIDLMVKVANEADCEIIERPASSLFTKNKVAGLREYWIHREQLMKLMDWIESNPNGLQFGPRDINTVSMVQFVGAFARNVEGGV